MRLDDAQKKIYLPRLWYITQACYTGVELPAKPLFDRTVFYGDVFVPATDYIESYALVTPDYHPPLLRSVATLPLFRKKGHASLLLAEMHAYYRGRGEHSVILHCKVNNPAQKLYFDAGYRVTKVLKGYYAQEGNGLEMEKEL